MTMNGDPWEQSETGLEGLDDDCELDEDSEESELGAHDEDPDPEPAPESFPEMPIGQPANGAPRLPRGGRPAPRKQSKQSKYTLRAMSPRIRQLFPHARSILISLDNGKQVLFVRKEG